MVLKRLHAFCCIWIMVFIAGDDHATQKETCQSCHNQLWHFQWSAAAVYLQAEFSSMYNSNLYRNNARSGGYRGNTVNQRNNMTDSEQQTSEYECNNSTGTQNPQNQPTQWVTAKAINVRPISQVKCHECLRLIH